jgi:hypothetical protein
LSGTSCLRASTKPFPWGRGKAVPPWGGAGGRIGLGESQPARDVARTKTVARVLRVIGRGLLEIEIRQEAGPSASLPRAPIVELIIRSQ